MILMHDQQNPLTSSNYILHAPQEMREIEKEREKNIECGHNAPSAVSNYVSLSGR